MTNNLKMMLIEVHLCPLRMPFAFDKNVIETANFVVLQKTIDIRMFDSQSNKFWFFPPLGGPLTTDLHSPQVNLLSRSGA